MEHLVRVEIKHALHDVDGIGGELRGLVYLLIAVLDRVELLIHHGECLDAVLQKSDESCSVLVGDEERRRERGLAAGECSQEDGDDNGKVLLAKGNHGASFISAGRASAAGAPWG